MGKYKIYQIAPVLDSITSSNEQAAIITLIEEKCSVALDLTHCTYVSSAGLSVILYAYKIAKDKGLDICLVGVSNEIKEVMHMTGFDKFFRFYHTIDEII